MSKLKIELEAIYQNAEKGFNKTTDSVDALRKTLITTGKEGEKFDQAVFRELTSAGERFGYELKGLEKALDLVRKQMSYLSQGVGEDNAQLGKLAKTTALYQAEIDKLNEAKAADARRTKEQIAAAEEMNNIQRQTIQMLEERARVQNQLNSKNANIGFMMLTDDRIGVANYTLKEYEQTLKQVIADTGVNSEETQKALALYQEQAKYVAVLNESTKNLSASTKDYNTVKNQTIRVEESHASKLLSVAKNILKFQLLMAPITGTIRGLKTFISDSTKAAAEAEQVFNKLATVYGNAADQAERMAQALSASLGVAKSTSAGALSTVGDLLQAQGMGTAQSLSTASRWTTQFADIIAFKDINMSLEEFAQNFMSGAAGNLRNFRTFGSIVKESAVQARLMAQGLDKLTRSELELAKMTTRAEMALEQQKNAMGATGREWDTVLSVNRRLNEASKQLKENFGAWLNEGLKPIKTIWLEILDTINEAVASSKELPQFKENLAQANPAVIFNRTSNSDTWERESRQHVGGWANMYGRMSESTDASEIAALERGLRSEARDIVKMFVSFGMTVDEGVEALKEDYITMQSLTDDWWGSLDIFGGFIEYLSQYAEWGKRLLGRSEWETETESVGSSFDTFLESLMGITGVGNNISTGDVMDANSHQSFAAQLASVARQAGIDAFNNINAADLSEFVDAVSLALGEVTEEDMLGGKAESLKNLYTTLFNQFTKDKTLQQNADLLERIANEYKAITGNVLDINEGLTEFQKALAQMQGVTSNYDVQLAQLRMTDDQKLTDNLRRQYAEAYALAATPEEQRQIYDAYEEAEQTLLAFLNAQRIYNEELKKEAAEKERLAQYKAAVKTISESTADYAAQMAQVGMTDNEKALDDLRIAYEKMRSELTLTDEEAKALNTEYNAQRQALINLQARQKEYNDFLASEAARLAAAEAAVTAMRNGERAQGIMANYAMTTINPLQATGKYASADTWRAGQRAGLRETEAQLLGLGVAASEVNAWIAKMTPLINEEYEAKKAEIDATEEATEALKKAQQWLAVEKRVTGSMGTAGGVIQSFQGEGDIWTKLVNALLTILENTESWPEMAETLNSIFNMFEPVAEALLDLIMSLPWEDIIFMLKVVASAITIISAIVQGIQTVIKWLWNNIKTALKNVATDVYNLFHPFHQRSRDQYTSFEELGNMLAKIYDDTTVYLERIWNANEDIVRNTDKDNLAVLRDLYARKIINEDQFYAGARVMQKDMIFDPVSADSTKYVAKGAGASSSVSYGGVTIQFNGSNSEEMKRWITDFFNQNGIGYNMAIGG